MEQIYCTVGELTDDLGQLGLSESAILGKIQAASQEILRDLGQFLPTLETRYYEGDGCEDDLLVNPLLSVTSITNFGVTLSGTDYILQPDGRHWKKGPYSSIDLYDLGTQRVWSDYDRGVCVTGKWGMYDETVSVPVTAVSQLIGDTNIVVSDGSQVSPGMVLLLESEWELVTGTGAATAGVTTLSAGIDDTVEEIGVANGALVKTGEMVQVDFERMKILDISGNTLLVARGINGTKRASHVISAPVNVFRTYSVTRGANGSTAAGHSSAAVSRQVAPADVNYLCRQIAALMIRKAQTGYVGRAGNDELGTGFFVNEFPKNQVEKVKANYFWGGL
jgi:hypothetical protein